MAQLRSHQLTRVDSIELHSVLQNQAVHTCSRQCRFSSVFGNIYRCEESGQAHVCDQTCNQRIWWDNASDICRLSKRVFPRAADGKLCDVARCVGRPAAQAPHSARCRTAGAAQCRGWTPAPCLTHPPPPPRRKRAADPAPSQRDTFAAKRCFAS